MKDQLEINDTTFGDADRLAKALKKHGFEMTESGAYAKDNCRVVIANDGIVFKHGKNEDSGLTVLEVIVRMNKLFKKKI
ncbi:hypothetical protein [Runella sp.]|uniref:hypothetical protein n=1 Tax=Runella sp. TaxID=1960881 RepID=UPI003D10F744